jgi:hypothetical protein
MIGIKSKISKLYDYVNLRLDGQTEFICTLNKNHLNYNQLLITNLQSQIDDLKNKICEMEKSK